MDEVGSITTLLQKLKLWQVVLVLGVAAPIASHYGWEIPQLHALGVFVVMTSAAVVIRYFPPPEPSERRYAPNTVISAHQTAFCSQFKDWTPFEDAVATLGPEDNDTHKRRLTEIKQLRLELGTAQRILMRKVENGRYYVKYYRADDDITHTPID